MQRHELAPARVGGVGAGCCESPARRLRTCPLPKLDHEAGSRHIRFDGRHRPQEGQLLTFSPSFHSDALARLADDRAVRSWSYYGKWRWRESKTCTAGATT